MSHEFVAKNGIISQGNIVISGSITTTGGITVSGSIASASYSLSSSYASSSTSASYAVSSSYALSSSYSLSSSYAANATSASYALSSSYAYNSTLHNGTASAVFATTGSNNLVGDQHITSTTIANAFTSTASLYTDGGLQVTKDAYFSSSMFIKGNLTIYGTQSIAYITSSQLNIATNLITVNTATPAVRFGGLAVYDSGSTGTGMTGSLLWDSQNNNWIYDNPSGSGNYDSAMVIMGPRNASTLGNEQGLTCNYLVLGHGSHHTTSSMVFHDGSTTCLPGTVITSCNLGIGVFPVLKLDVQGNAADTITVSGVTVEQITLFRPSNGVGGIRTGFNTTTGDAYLWSAQSSANLYLGSRVAPNNNANVSIFSSGNVGINTGTTDACYKLDVNGTGRFSGDVLFNSAIQLGASSYIYGSVANGFRVLNNANTVALLTIANSGAATFSSSVTAAGTSTTPTFWAKGGMDGSGTGKGNFRSSDAGGTNYWDFGRDNLTTGNFVLTSGGGSPLLSITTTGAATFSSTISAKTESEFTGTSVNTRILITASGVANTVIGFNNSGATTTGVINNAGYVGILQAYPLVFTTDGTERLRITSTGNVGIGTSNPLADLQVSRTGEVVIAMGNNGSITSGNRGTLAWYNSADSTVAIIRATAVTDNVGTQLEFYTRPAAGSLAQKMILNSSGRLLVGGGVTDNGASIQTNGDIRADYSSAIYLEINGGAAGDYRKGFSGVNQQTGVARGLHLFNYDPDSSQGIKFFGGTYAAKVRFGGFDSGGNFFVNSADSAEGYKLYVNGTVGVTGAATFSGNISNSGNLNTYKSGGGGNPKQVVVGQTTAAASGTAKKIAYVGYSHSVRVYVWANQSAANGSSAIADITTLYGSSSGGTTAESSFGNVSDIVVTYDNGGSPAYTINVTLVYTGTAPTINYVVEGISHDNSIYAIA